MTAEISRTGLPIAVASRWALASAEIGLGDHEQFGPFAQVRIVGGKLVANRPIIGDRFGTIGRLRLNQMDEDSRPFHVSQKFMAESHALVRPFDQSRDVGHDERAVQVDLDAAQIGVFRGKWIRGDLRPGARQPAQQGALAGIGFSYQADVSDDFQFQAQAPDLGRTAGGRLARRPIGRRLEVKVAPAPPPAGLVNDYLVPLVGQVLRTKPRSAS